MNLKEEIEKLLNTEVLVESNEGTFGAEECCRKVGCGNPAFGNRRVYKTLSGRGRVTGPALKDAPGRMRRMGQDELERLREQVKDLRALAAAEA